MIWMRGTRHWPASLPVCNTCGDFGKSPLGNEGALAGTKATTCLATPPPSRYPIDENKLSESAPMGRRASGEPGQGDVWQPSD